MTSIVIPDRTPEHQACETALHVAMRTCEIPISGNPRPIKFTVSDDGCWIADGCRNYRGYIQKRSFGKTEYAHRLSFMHFCGDTRGLFVLHDCDNPSCCNPKHLLLGTHQDNMDDMKAKGRRLNKCVKISDDDVIKAKHLRNQGKSFTEIASLIGCSEAQAVRVVNGSSRKSLSKNVKVKKINLSIKVSDDQIKLAIKLARSGMTYVSVAKEIGVTPFYISKIMRGKSKRGFENGL